MKWTPLTSYVCVCVCTLAQWGCHLSNKEHWDSNQAQFYSKTWDSQGFPLCEQIIGLFRQFLRHGRLSGFQVFSITNKAAVNNLVMYRFIPVRYNPLSGVAVSEGGPLKFWWWLPFVGNAPFCSLTENGHWCLPFECLANQGFRQTFGILWVWLRKSHLLV